MSMATAAERSPVGLKSASHGAESLESANEPGGEPGSPAATHQGRSRWKAKTQETNPKPQNTHFVCFPLSVNDETVAQLSKSLEYFRTVTRATDPSPWPRQHRAGQKDSIQEAEDQAAREKLSRQLRGDSMEEPETPPHGKEVRVTEDDPHRPQPRSTQPESGDTHREDDAVPSLASLRVIPAQAYRPPGTFHLTIGMLDLSEASRYDRALALLQSLDLAALLKEVETGPEAGVPSSSRTTGRDSRRSVLNPASESVQNATPSVKPASHDGPGTQAQTHLPDAGAAAAQLNTLTRPISPPSLASPGPPREGVPASTPPSPLRITLHSLSTFPRASAARVFYAHPRDRTHRLLRFANLIRDAFAAQLGLTDGGRPLTLHATLANMIYVRGRHGGARGKGKGRGKGRPGEIDARDVIRHFSREVVGRPFEDGWDDGEYDGVNGITWAAGIPVDRVRICKLGAVESRREGWGLEYAHVGEKVFAGPEASRAREQVLEGE